MRRKITIVLITFASLALLIPTEYGMHGEATALTKNLEILSVRDKSVNNLILLLEKTGYKVPGDKSTDRYIENADAYGLARRYLGYQKTEGLYLTVKKNTKSFNAGLRNGDIISNITFEKGCNLTSGNINKNWVSTYACRSSGTIFRDGKLFKIHLPRRAAEGAVGLRVISNSSPATPKVINQDTGLSAGLILTLYYVDMLTPGSLFSKDKVSGSGVIDPINGSFTEVAALNYKYKAAVKSKSTILFLTRRQDISELRIEKSDGVRIEKIENINDAIKILCNRGADDKLCLKNAKE